MAAVRVLLIILVIAGTIGGAIWIEDDLLGWFARYVRRDDVRRARWTVFWVHSGVLVALILATVLAIILKDSGVSAAWVAVPCALLAGPFVFNLLPSKFSGFQDLRRDLQRRGASKAAARAIAWVGAPFVFIEMSVLAVMLIMSFAG